MRGQILTSENTSIQTESEFELLSMLFKLKDSLLKLVGLMIRPKIECLKAKYLIHPVDQYVYRGCWNDQSALSITSIYVPVGPEGQPKILTPQVMRYYNRTTISVTPMIRVVIIRICYHLVTKSLKILFCSFEKDKEPVKSPSCSQFVLLTSHFKMCCIMSCRSCRSHSMSKF
jgi:hypothetical protein